MNTQPEHSEFERAIESRLRDTNWDRMIAERVVLPANGDPADTEKPIDHATSGASNKLHTRSTKNYYTSAAIAATVLLTLGVFAWNPALLNWNADSPSSQFAANDAAGDWMTVVDPGLGESNGYVDETYGVEPYLTLAVFEE